MANFCHIAPVPHLKLVEGRPVHLVLAHLIDDAVLGQQYVDFYLEQKQKYGCTLIMDNSAFEMFKQNKPMYPSDRLIACAERVQADYIIMSDYPGEPSEKTIEAAKKLAPEIHDASFKTFFVPQGKRGSVEDAVDAFRWASLHPQYVDYVGISILTAPLAYNVEKGNNLQRFVSRMRLLYEMKESLVFARFKDSATKIHFLGMVDGPNEIMYMHAFKGIIDTWDSSAAVWCGLNGIKFDKSPTGLILGKYEREVDFGFDLVNSDVAKSLHLEYNDTVRYNMNYIDKLVAAYL